MVSIADRDLEHILNGALPREYHMRAYALYHILKEQTNELPPAKKLRLEENANRHAWLAEHMTDEATGFYNSEGFHEILRHFMRQNDLARDDDLITIVYLGINGFKIQSDPKNYTADGVLKKASALARKSIISTDLQPYKNIPALLRENEAVFLVKGINEHQAICIAQRMHSRINSGFSGALDISIGFKQYHEYNLDPEVIIAQAKNHTAGGYYSPGHLRRSA